MRLRIYNMLGQEVAKLVDETQDAGYKQVEWDAPRHVGTSGVYIYRLTDGKFSEARKLLLLK